MPKGMACTSIMESLQVDLVWRVGKAMVRLAEE